MSPMSIRMSGPPPLNLIQLGHSLRIIFRKDVVLSVASGSVGLCLVSHGWSVLGAAPLRHLSTIMKLSAGELAHSHGPLTFIWPGHTLRSKIYFSRLLQPGRAAEESHFCSFTIKNSRLRIIKMSASTNRPQFDVLATESFIISECQEILSPIPVQFPDFGDRSLNKMKGKPGIAPWLRSWLDIADHPSWVTKTENECKIHHKSQRSILHRIRLMMHSCARVLHKPDPWPPSKKKKRKKLPAQLCIVIHYSHSCDTMPTIHQTQVQKAQCENQ